MRKITVIGVSHSEFGVRKDVNPSELPFEALKPALKEYVDNGRTGKTAGRRFYQYD